MSVISGKKDKLNYRIYENRTEMGKAAAIDAAAAINEVIAKKGRANLIFAAAPSQNDFLSALLEQDIDWTKVNGFHMDEYVGLDKDAPQGFGNFLRAAIFGRVPFNSVNYLDISAVDSEAECERYTKVLKENPTDIVFMGIGENGHIAFNDPAVAEFHDPKTVKIVELDDICRQQQVNDGCFKTIDDVPKTAMTLTIPTLMAPAKVFCIVPAKTKAKAVNAVLTGPITEDCPATILREHDDATLYAETDSAALFLAK